MSESKSIKIFSIYLKGEFMMNLFDIDNFQIFNLAAKTANYKIDWDSGEAFIEDFEGNMRSWNPFDSEKDALELADSIDSFISINGNFIVIKIDDCSIKFKLNDEDTIASTRRKAIVLAASYFSLED